MHQFDEAEYLLDQLFDPDSKLKLRNHATEMDRRYLSIQITGNYNRNLVSLKKHKKMKAHERRFFIQHAAPFILNDENVYKVFSYASRIAWGCRMKSHRKILRN